MNYYERKIFPIINDLVTKDFDCYRGELLDHAKGKVLEVGMGTGLTFEFYTKEVSEIHGIDPNVGMVEKAQLRADDKLHLHVAKAEDLPFEDDSFDTIVAFLVLCSVSDLEKSILEMKRVLRPTGQLLFFEHVAPAEGSFHRVFFEKIDPLWQIPACGCHLTRDTGTKLEECGFEIVHFKFSKEPSRLIPIIRGRALHSS